jgi:hypothetical protein
VDPMFHGSPRTWHPRERCLSRQSKRHSHGEERQSFELEAHEAHQCPLLFCDGSDSEEGPHSGMVSHGGHDWRLHDKTELRSSLYEVQRPDHGSCSRKESRTRQGQEGQNLISFNESLVQLSAGPQKCVGRKAIHG